MRQIRFLLLFLFLLPACAFAREVPVGDFFKEPKFSSITLSPDGKHIAITVPQEDRTQLAILRVADSALVGKFDYGVNRHFDDVYWVSNERIVFWLGFKTGRYDFQTSRGDMYAANIDGSRRIDIMNGATYNVLGRVPGEPGSLFVSRSVENAFLFKLNTVTGRVLTVAMAQIDNGSFLVDHDGKVRYAYGEMNDGRYTVLRRDGDAWTEVHRSNRQASRFVPLRFAADNKRLYALQSDAGEPERVVLIDPEKGEPTTVSVNRNVAPSGFRFSSDRKTLLAVEYDDGLPSWDFVAPEHPESKLLASLNNSFGDRAVDFFEMTEDARYVGLRVYSDVAPPEAYLFDRSTGQAQFLTSSMEWIKPAEMSETRAFSLKARDGTDLHGYLTLPRDAKGPVPMIVHPHGGPYFVRDHWGFNPEVQAMASRGYAVLQLNFRGSEGYGLRFQEAGYRKWGTAMQDDVTDAVQWAIRQGHVDRARICLYGASYGGYTALMSVVREPDLYRCTVGHVGVYSLPMMRQKGDIAGTDYGRSFLDRVLPTSAGELQAQSPAFNVDRIKVPVMLVQGALDERVPIAQMNFLVSQMKAAGKAPEDVIVEKKEAHGFRDVANNVNFYTRMLAFFDRHIGDGAKQAPAAASPDPRP